MSPQAKSSPPPSRVYANIYQTIPHMPFNTTVDFAIAKAIKPVAGYTFYTVNVPGPQFTFDLQSVVNDVTYTEDARDTFFIPVWACFLLGGDSRGILSDRKT